MVRSCRGRLIDRLPESIQAASNEVCLVQCDMRETGDDIGQACPFALSIIVGDARSDFVPNRVKSGLRTGDVDRIIQR